MHPRPNTFKNIVMAGAASLLLLPQLAWSDGGARYKVTIYNLTAGQPFTPPTRRSMPPTPSMHSSPKASAA